MMLSLRGGCHITMRWIGYHKHRTRRLANYPVSRRAQHQTVKSAPAVGSHDDDSDVVRLRKRQNQVRRIPPIDDELRLNSSTPVLLHELFQFRAAAFT